MRKRICFAVLTILLAWLLMASFGKAQTTSTSTATTLGVGFATNYPQTPTPTPLPLPQSTFSITAQAVALPGGKETVPGTVVGATFALTDRFSLRSDNLLAPGNNLQGYFGGFQYALPWSKKVIAKTKLNPQQFQFYITGSVGIDRIVPATGPSAQHYAFLAGGGLNYDPSASGRFSVNLFEVRYAKLPGIANSTAIVSTGIKLGF